ncbi:MAG: hypothetical protein ACOYL6_18750 [Bacteriovoracaceae bacterium]
MKKFYNGDDKVKQKTKKSSSAEIYLKTMTQKKLSFEQQLNNSAGLAFIKKTYYFQKAIRLKDYNTVFSMILIAKLVNLYSGHKVNQVIESIEKELERFQYSSNRKYFIKNDTSMKLMSLGSSFLSMSIEKMYFVDEKQSLIYSWDFLDFLNEKELKQNKVLKEFFIRDFVEVISEWKAVAKKMNGSNNGIVEIIDNFLLQICKHKKNLEIFKYLGFRPRGKNPTIYLENINEFLKNQKTRIKEPMTQFK